MMRFLLDNYVTLYYQVGNSGDLCIIFPQNGIKRRQNDVHG